MFRNWKLGAKTLIPTVVVAVIVTIGLALMVQVQQRNMAIDQARRTAQAITRQVAAERKVYTETVVSKLKKDGVSIAPLDLKSFRSVQGGIPLPASFVHATSEVVNAKGLHSVDLLSLWNINPSKGPRSQFEEEALKYVVNNQNELKDAVLGSGDQARYVQVSADVASIEACVTCHNGHPASPKRDFGVGDTMGAVVISLPLAAEFASVRTNTITLTVFAIGAIALVTAVVLLFQWMFVNRPVVQSLNALEKAAERISTGELDEPVAQMGDDEIGRLAKAFERMRLSLKAAMDAMDKQ